MAIRVPTPNVSLIDLVVEVEKESSVQLVNIILIHAVISIIAIPKLPVSLKK